MPKTSLLNIARLGIGAKIGLIMAMMLVPLGLMTYLFIAQAQKDTDFARLEIDGSNALVPLWRGLSLATAPDASAPQLAGIAKEIAGNADALEAEFGGGSSAKAFATALSGAASQADRVDAAKAIIQKVSDKSNLTLDPDVDSYYVMDVVTVRLPELLGALGELRGTTAVFGRADAKASPEDFVALVRSGARFEGAVSPIVSSLGSAFGGNADGSLEKALGGKLAAFKSLAASVEQAEQALIAAVGKGANVTAAAKTLAKSEADLHAFAVQMWPVVNAELQRLLNTRIDGLTQNAVTKLAMAAACLLVIAVLGFLAARQIRRQIADLVACLMRFRRNEYGFEIPHTELPNETGEIARALRRFQDLGSQQSLIMAALDGSSTMLMITDPDEKVVFMSGSLLNLFMKLEPTFRSARHDFSVEKMFGEHINYYDQNASLKRELIVDDGKVRKVRLEVAGHTILVDMSYIYSADGGRLGHTLLWHDMTAELEAQVEVARVVSAAADGDFSQRLEMAGKSGFVREIADGLNRICDSVDSAINDFAEVLESLAAGDLTRKVGRSYKGSLGRMQANIDETIDRLAETVATIQATAVDVSTAASEIATGADDLAKRTEQQAASLVETGSTTDALSQSVKASVTASRDAVGLADGATRVATTGGTIVTQTVDAMSRIEQASQKISAITSVIDDIAFQTNLLALNAAVEAARAGEAGKGFAVVASEVRTLAQRSSDAAKDITGLISTSTTEVAEGVKLVRSAGEVLGKIVDASRQVSETVSRIAEAASEQANGISEMTTAISHMDDMTQQNAALAEESAASATTLSSQIQRLNDLVATFRTSSTRMTAMLKDNTPAPAPSRPAAAPRGEPERLRRLAEQAFAAAPSRPAAPKPRAHPPAAKVAAAGAGSAGGWEEF